jgi:hypothetical protein
MRTQRVRIVNLVTDGASPLKHCFGGLAPFLVVRQTVIQQRPQRLVAAVKEAEVADAF